MSDRSVGRKRAPVVVAAKRGKRDQHVLLVFCEPCTDRVHASRPGINPHTSPRALCDECTAKLAQAARILTSAHLAAYIGIPKR